MTGVEFSARQLTIASLIAALLSIILWSGTYAHITDANIQIDKDPVSEYLCGAEFLNPSLHEEQTKLVAHLEQVIPPSQAHYVYRAQLRASYCNNYLLTSLSMYAAGRLQIYFGVNDPAKDFPAFLLSSMRWGTGASGALLGVLCLIVVFWTARGALMLAAFGAIVLAGVLYVKVTPPALSWMLYDTDASAPFAVLRHIIKLGLLTWLNATVPFSAFSTFPRCFCAMVAFAAFILRWSGRGGLAYWAVIVISFVHQSEAPIVLVTMLGCDLLLRPQVLLTRPYVVPIAIGVIVIALRERMLSILGLPWVPLGEAVGVLVALVAVVSLISGLRSAVQSLWQTANGWRLELSKWSTPLVEALLILAAWFVILLICFAFRHDQAYRVIYLWSELPSRFVGLFQFTVFTGLIYPACVMLMAKLPNASRLAFAGICALALLLAYNQWNLPWIPKETLVANSLKFDEPVAKGYSGVAGASFSKIETPWYYLMVHKAFLGGDGIDEYFAKH